MTEKQLRDLTVQHELLLQAFEKVNPPSDHGLEARSVRQVLNVSVLQVEQERDELLRRQTEAVLDLQQRSGLKELLLERKLSALTDTVEQKEAQLCAALSACRLDPAEGSSSANKLQVRVLCDSVSKCLSDQNTCEGFSCV